MKHAKGSDAPLKRKKKASGRRTENEWISVDIIQ